MAPMTSGATWVVDTSGLARLSVPEVGEVLRPLIDAGRVAVTAVTLLEIGYTARSKADHARSQQSVLQRLQFVYASLSPATKREARPRGPATVDGTRPSPLRQTA
jgi:predicted nucleic acid-binding protein